MVGTMITFIPAVIGAYEVRIDGRLIGTVAKVGRIWTGRMEGGMEIGEHPTRQAAAEAMADVDSQ
jgi:hypothetical protein